MRREITILAIPGSLRRGSHSVALAQAARELAPAGVEVEVYEDLATIPPYSEDDEGNRLPHTVAELRRLIGEADAVLISTPEYNSSLPGQLKNALDWASRPFGESEFVGKPAAVIGASTGSFGAAWAQAEGRKVLMAMGARVVEDGASLAKAGERVDDKGNVTDPAVREAVEQVLNALVLTVQELELAESESVPA